MKDSIIKNPFLYTLIVILAVAIVIILVFMVINYWRFQQIKIKIESMRTNDLQTYLMIREIEEQKTDLLSSFGPILIIWIILVSMLIPMPRRKNSEDKKKIEKTIIQT